MTTNVMTRRISTTLALILAVLIGVSGCGMAGGGGKLVPVTGTVTIDGKPLAGASVTFMGLGATPGLGGVGTTDDFGKFEMSHFRAGKGVDPGEYKVIISKRVMSNGSPIPVGTLSIADLATRDLVPPRFSDYNATVLTTFVKEGAEPITFSLTSR